MPYCRNCGAVVNDTDRFCAKCGTPRTSVSAPIPAQHSIYDLIPQLGELKELLLGIYDVLDSIQTSLPALTQDVEDVELKRIFRMDIQFFLLYLCASDGKLTSEERDLINELFDLNISIDGYIQLINNFKINSPEFKQKVPCTLQVVTLFDHWVEENGLDSVPAATPIIMTMFRESGKVIIACDGDKDNKEITDYNNYIGFLDASISELLSSYNEGDDEPAVPALAKTPSNVVGTYYPASIYKVGNDIPAGKYKIFAENGFPYYSVCNDPNGDDIVTNDNFDNQAYVDIHNGQYLELSDCYAVPLKEASMFTGTTYGDGEYIVGQEIAPGEYKVQAIPGEDGYYSLETFAADGSRDIDSNRTFNNVAYVAPKQGQILVLKDCTLIK
jgi:hypothetical protein